MRLGLALLGAALAAVLAGCEKPPADAYVVSGEAAAASAVPVGNNKVGEACRYQPASPGAFGIDAKSAAAVYCGSWEQPSGRVYEFAGGADAASLRQLATAGPWRSYIDQRFACGAPVETRIAGGAPALLMQCTRRVGGWPHVAMTAAVGGRVFAADSLVPALPAVEATMAAITGQAVASSGAGPMSEAERLIAGRTTGVAFGSGDEGRYYELTRLGDAYNNVDDPAHAEQAFREALAVQQHYLAPDNPGLALTMMKLAAQIAHQRNAPEADRLLDNAARLAARANEPLLTAQLQYYRAVTAAYQGKTEVALEQSRLAEQSFARLVPASGLAQVERSAGAAPRSRGLDLAALTAQTARTTTEATAVTGLAETLRLRASLYRLAGNTARSTELAQKADDTLKAFGMGVSSTGGRALRQLASNEASTGDYSAAASYSSQAAQVLSRVVPGQRPDAITALQEGAYRLKQGDTGGALTLFRKAGQILRKPGVYGAPPTLILPWLDALYTEAEQNPGDRDRLTAEMFDAAQLAKGSLTAQSIARAAARLAASDPKVGAALRDLQDRQRELDNMEVERDRLVAEGGRAKDRLDDLDRRIGEAQKGLADAELQAQAAAPSYRRTIQEPVTDAELREFLQPDEALLAIFTAPNGSFGFLLRRDDAAAYRISLNQTEIGGLVAKLRGSVTPTAIAGQAGLPNYDTTAAYDLYAAMIGPIAERLNGKSRLTIAATGALLTFPMGALVTAPGVVAANGDYRQVPFLLRRFALSYVPAPRTFVDLRRIKTASPGLRPFVGFGDFRPASDRQIAALFPPDRCSQDNRLLHLLGPLPGTRTEVVTIGRELGAAPGDIILGEQFTKARLVGMDLSPYRIIHLATHALLPSELGQCQTDPAILTSVPAAAPGAGAGFLGVEDIEKLKTNADLVVLSACDTAGASNGAGESLSGLAQAFFRAGTRGMLVTQWGAVDVAAMRLMTGTLAPTSGGAPADTAQALRAAQLRMIDTAGSAADAPMLMSHPYAWAPFVLIGDGVRARAPGA